MKNKYQLAKIDEFQFDWLEDLENEKLNGVQLVLKIISNVEYIEKVKGLMNEAVKELNYNEVGPLYFLCMVEVKSTLKKIQKLISILNKRKGL